MNYFDILLAKKLSGGSPTPPGDTYERKSVTSYPVTDSANYPLPKCDVTVTDADKCEVIVTTDNTITEDSGVYIERQSGGGNRELDEIVGGSVVWNQLVQNGNFEDTTGWEVYNATLSTIAIANGICTQTIVNDSSTAMYEYAFRRPINEVEGIVGHKYITMCEVYSNKTRKYQISNNDNSLTLLPANVEGNANQWTRIYRISSGAQRTLQYFSAYPSTEVVTGDTIQYRNAMNFDLTALFGSTIADYIYSLEQATAGSGIAWLKSYGYLTDDYYGYTANKIESVSVARHITRGKNLFDNSPYSAWYIANDYAILQNHLPKDTRLTVSFTDRDTSVDISGCYFGFIESGVISNPIASQYKWVINNGVAQTDTNSPRNYQNKYLSDLMIYPKTQEVYDKIFSRFYVQIEYGTTATAYEPYHEPHTYPINPITLRGIPKLTNGELTYDGDTLESTGRVKRKRGRVVFNGTQADTEFSFYSSDGQNRITWTKFENIGKVGTKAFVSDRLIASVNYNALPPAWVVSNSGDNVTRCFIGVPNTIASVSDWQAYVTSNPITLEYELAAPTTEYTSPFATTQNVDSDGTEEYIDAGVEAGTRDVAIPVGHDTKYFNGKAYVKPLTAGTSDTVSMADMGIMPTSPMYISANGEIDAEYWKQAE